VRRLLIIKLSSLGDVAQALPMASALRRRFAELRVSWAVEERSAALLHGHAGVDRVIAFPTLSWNAVGGAWPGALARALRAVRAESYDVALDLQGLLKSSVVSLWSRAPLRLGLPPQREGAGLVSRTIPVRPGRVHAVDRYLDGAAYFGAPAEPVQFGVRVQPAARASLLRVLRQRGVPASTRLIVIAPSSAQTAKAWPEHRWAAVIDALADDGTVVLVGNAVQRRRHQALTERARQPPIDLTGATTLGELVALLDACVLHIAPDTGTLHIAAALGRPVIGIYGPTPPWRLGPYGQLDAAVRRDGTCGFGCPRLCVWGRRCLRAITPDEIIERARAVLAHSPPAAERDERVG
jgi:lipopolysaccharide heptosyltransferase I